MQTLPDGPQLYQGADRLRPNRGAEDLRETQQRGHAHQAPSILRLRKDSSQARSLASRPHHPLLLLLLHLPYQRKTSP